MIGIAVLGCGVVGSGVAEMLWQNAEEVKRAAGEEIKLLCGVDLREIELAGGLKTTSRFEDVLENSDVRIVAETIGGVKHAYDYTKRALSSGRHVVTSNKELVATHGDELVRLAAENNVSYLYEASVGGGIPVLHPILRLVAGNRISAVNGIVNGSTNYLLTQMAEKGVSFPTALSEAKALGYVEGNPAADVEGWDARRKLAILANAAFGSHFADDVMIPTCGISAITEEDIASAHAFGCSVKLIAHAECQGQSWGGWVRPCAVRGGHPLHPVSDVFNGIMITGNCVGDLMFYGRGAGSLPTASAVVGDLIDAVRHIDKPVVRHLPPKAPAFKALADDKTRFILSIGEQDAEAIAQALPGGEKREGAYMTAPIGMQAMFEKCNELNANGCRLHTPLPVLD